MSASFSSVRPRLGLLADPVAETLILVDLQGCSRSYSWI
jgi:hypothetical protein